jgi:hypothetical protein
MSVNIYLSEMFRRRPDHRGWSESAVKGDKSAAVFYGKRS